MKVEFRIVRSASSECWKSYHSRVLRFLDGYVMFVSMYYHVMLRVVTVLPKNVLRFPIRESIVSVVRYEPYSSVCERGDVRHEVFHLYVEVHESALHEFVDHPSHCLFAVYSVFLRYTVMVSSLALEPHYLSFLVQRKEESFDDFYDEHR